MTWNHRVLRHKDGTLGIHEVYYEGPGQEEWACTMEPAIVGDTPEELLEVLTQMAECVAKPFLDYEDF